MGYVETLCQLCRVSFAIARIRRKDEPEEAAWDYTGSGHVETVTYTQDSDSCGYESGCETLESGDREGEHIAGPGCVSTAGYSGHRISVEEMEGCRAVQALLEKGTGWKPEPDDQEFELEGDYFLTGIGDGSPDEAPLEDIKPARHGINEACISNFNFEVYEGQGDGLPFHPTCFQIFKKVSQLQLGKIDVEGLWYWRELEDFYSDCSGDEPTKSGQDQWWIHNVGHEYLAANPIKVPGLSDLLLPQKYSGTTTFGWQYQKLDGEQPKHHEMPAPRSTAKPDLLRSLPAEIAALLLSYLGSKDIANLRLVSPSFRQLPTILFKRLLLEDMPWMWEARDLPLAEIDWHALYVELKSGSADLKGLRNRKRIWLYLEEVIRRIQKYRDEGKIGK